MATWPADGDENWNTKMLAYLAVEHNTDGTHDIVGSSVQVVNTQTGVVATSTSIIPFDNTIPQITEGTQVMSLAITPTNINNKLKIDVVCHVGGSVDDPDLVVALFQDATASALAVGYMNSFRPRPAVVTFTHYMTAGTISATTFKIRIGARTANTITFNGYLSAAKYGGVIASSITITEIKV